MYPTPPPSPGPMSCSPESRIGYVLANTYRLTQVLGVGAYGTVYRAYDIYTNIEYAVKALNKVGLDARQRKFQDREIRLHHLASQHPSVVSLEKILDSPDCTYVVIEFCSEGDLFSKITEQGEYVRQDFRAKHVFRQILAAVQHCHSRGIYHRDLKPENILVSNNGWTVKLADFGLATEERFTYDFGCGSTFYMSPECQQSNPSPYTWYASAPNDVWALGVILVNLTCGRNPWKRACMNDPTYRAYTRDRDFLKTILPISDELNTILRRIFEPDANKRITLAELQCRIDCCNIFTVPLETGILTPPATPEDSPCDEETDDAAMEEPCDSISELEQLPGPRFVQDTSVAAPAPPSITTWNQRSNTASSYGAFSWDPMRDFRGFTQFISHLNVNMNVPNHLFTTTR